MSRKLKTSYELALERMIAPPSPESFLQEEEQGSDVLDKFDDFIPVEEFDVRTDEDEIQWAGEHPDNKILNLEHQKRTSDKLSLENTMTYKDIIVKGPDRIVYDEEQLEVHWYGDFLGYTGFSRMNRIMAFELSNRNVLVKIDDASHLVNVNQSTQKEIRLLTQTDISDVAPKVFGATTPLNMMHAGRKILYTMIETSGGIHKDYAGKLNMMDEIWVPTEYGRKILEEGGVRPKIYVMPLGVDIGRYSPNARPSNIKIPLKDFTFLSVFRWSYRKGIDILLRAYLEEFSSDESVSLLLISRAVEKIGQTGIDHMMKDFGDIRSTVNKSDENLPHVALYPHPVPEKDMPGIYKKANVFILVSRGEGFSLPYVEAGAIGLPVIASNCSGQTDYLNEDNSFLVEPDGYVEANINGQLSHMAKLCHFYEGQIFPDFKLKAFNKVKEHMRYVYEHYEEAREKADNFRALVKERYSWGMAVDRVYNRLKEIKE